MRESRDILLEDGETEVQLDMEAEDCLVVNAGQAR